MGRYGTFPYRPTFFFRKIFLQKTIFLDKSSPFVENTRQKSFLIEAIGFSEKNVPALFVWKNENQVHILLKLCRKLF
jgi:hypothetical protein